MTKGEMQTPVHYAAKNDAGKALKILLKLGGSMEGRDYKNRTPLQIAAELGMILIKEIHLFYCIQC
jgi:ankyrin repeat protein